MDRIKDIGGFTDAGARKRLAAMLSAGAVKHTEKGYYFARPPLRMSYVPECPFPCPRTRLRPNVPRPYV